MKILFEILDEILAEHPEHTPAVELIVQKVNDRIDEEVMFLRSMVGRLIASGSTRKQ